MTKDEVSGNGSVASVHLVLQGNMQSRMEVLLAANRTRQADDYLRSDREAPRSRYEIKAGWEIPPVLEQSLNSDLPGELKALVTSNVYDPATSLFLLIQQGLRLIGKYDSRIAYGQDGVQVAWSRIIFPDATSLDLDGMLGLDSHGNAGMRDKVDHHYRRLIGFTVLTSLFTAAFNISQRANQTTCTYPTPAQTAGSAVGQELSETGALITRRNLNVTNDQGPCWLQVHGPCKSGHLVRNSISTDSA
jgi:type IV secretory pathway VirB10-like protein